MYICIDIYTRIYIYIYIHMEVSEVMGELALKSSSRHDQRPTGDPWDWSWDSKIQKCPSSRWCPSEL